MLLHAQWLETTHTYCLQFPWVRNPGTAQPAPPQDWSQRVWQGSGLIWDLTGGGSTPKLTEGVSKMYDLVVVGPRDSFSCWLVTKAICFLKTSQGGRGSSNPGTIITHMLSCSLCCILVSKSKSQVPPTTHSKVWVGWLHKGMNTEDGDRGVTFRVCPPQCLIGLSWGGSGLIHISLLEEDPFSGSTVSWLWWRWCSYHHQKKMPLMCTCSWKVWTVFRESGTTGFNWNKHLRSS